MTAMPATRSDARMAEICSAIACRCSLPRTAAAIVLLAAAAAAATLMLLPRRPTRVVDPVESRILRIECLKSRTASSETRRNAVAVRSFVVE